ncbi:MarR family transcriptional regulator [uncultured Meiothermus sp.]|uniref:MarR family winged helix-turn-helix transcriptional regulator n=1 Tax=uncultured Meiothermus sp. TaxID=157471 RepID=UPI0026158C75|nr:MarR family transcriptional regulator [uncultured Meiothermus sp.]
MVTLKPDLETRLAEDHPQVDSLRDGREPEHLQAIRLWLRLLTCTNLITTEIRTRLRESFQTTLPRFDLLAQLERHPQGLKMGELSRRMMVTTGNITGITDQLEAEGLVRRAVDPRDRRSFTVKLTPQGRKVFAEMARVHEGWVIEFFSGLGAAEKDSLFTLLGRLKAHLNGKEARP